MVGEWAMGGGQSGRGRTLALGAGWVVERALL